MTLDEAVLRLEACFKVHPEVCGQGVAPTGEPFVTVVTGGVKSEGEPSPIIATSEALAVEYWLRAAMQYAAGKSGGTLYWRIRPEVVSAELVTVGIKPEDTAAQRYYKIYSRLLISSAPIRGAASAETTSPPTTAATAA